MSGFLNRENLVKYNNPDIIVDAVVSLDFFKIVFGLKFKCMSEIEKIVERSAEFYNTSFLQFDYTLADFAYQTLQPYFKGRLGLELGPSSGYMTKSLIKEFEILHLVEGSENLFISDSGLSKCYEISFSV